jgi:hypothetical protein
VLIVENDHGTWPLITCRCGAVDDLSLVAGGVLLEPGGLLRFNQPNP